MLHCLRFAYYQGVARFLMIRFPIKFLFLISTTAVGVSSGTVVQNGSSSSTALSFASQVGGGDLINAGSSDVISTVVSASNASFPGSGMIDGNYSDSPGENTFFEAGLHFPATATFDLDVASHPLGYDLSSIESFMGWSAQHSDQVYSVEFKRVGSASFSSLASVDYRAFTGVTQPSYETRVEIEDDAGRFLASGVESIRFTFDAPGIVSGSGDTMIREIDVYGAPSVLMITSPVPRQVVQRDGNNQADILIEGSYVNSPDSIEARAVVLGSGNSGTDTGWEVIDSSPSSGLYSGTLENVSAGGWYTIEVRSVTGGVSSGVYQVGKIGVGDIFITAGQSNSANFGGPAFDPLDDRVSAVTLTDDPQVLPPWVKGSDPQPFADGPGGSVWSRLGEQLTSELDIPVAFLSLGVGSAPISFWTSPSPNYDNRLKEGIQYFPPNGFRAFLWHQGERDSSDGKSKGFYVDKLQSIIAQSRIDAGWDIPWYVAEAAYQSATAFGNREVITAAQRDVAHADPLTFLGPRTEDFHWENASGGKLLDGVHLNGAGFDDHATQWREILGGSGVLMLENGDFEKGFDPSVTTIVALSENGQSIIDPFAGGIHQGVVDWVVLNGNLDEAADGANGVFNPGGDSYDNAVDSINGGVLPGMSGKHVGFLYGGSANNNFQQTRRVPVVDHRIYTVTVSLGVRDGDSTDVFGGALLQILADGVPQGAGLSVIESDLDTLAGGSADGTFQTLSTSFSTSEGDNNFETLGVKLTKVSGAGNSYLDFDNISFSESLTRYGSWQVAQFVTDSDDRTASGDPDGDGLSNLLEFTFGTSPTDGGHSKSPLTVSGNDFELYRRVAADAGLEYELQSSTTLAPNSWSVVPNVTTEVDSSDGEFETVLLSRPGGWASGQSQEFFRIAVSFAP